MSSFMLKKYPKKPWLLSCSFFYATLFFRIVLFWSISCNASQIPAKRPKWSMVLLSIRQDDSTISDFSNRGCGSKKIRFFGNKPHHRFGQTGFLTYFSKPSDLILSYLTYSLLLIYPLVWKKLLSLAQDLRGFRQLPAWPIKGLMLQF